MEEEFDKKPSMIEEMESIAEAVRISEKHGLLCEVFLFALREMQNNPELSIEECLDSGLYEFDL